MVQKPRNELQEQQERAEKARRKAARQKHERMIKRRTGISRKNQQVTVRGLPMALTSAEMIREREYRVFRGRTSRRGRPKATLIHLAIWRYTLQSADGRRWTALQAQAHDGDFGYMLNITGLWGLKPV